MILKKILLIRKHVVWIDSYVTKIEKKLFWKQTNNSTITKWSIKRSTLCNSQWQTTIEIPFTWTPFLWAQTKIPSDYRDNRSIIRFRMCILAAMRKHPSTCKMPKMIRWVYNDWCTVRQGDLGHFTFLSFNDYKTCKLKQFLKFLELCPVRNIFND